MQTMRIRLANICAILLAWAGSLAAATLHVDLGGTGDFMSIQAAIDAAASGVDEIEVAPGIYYEAIDFHGKAVRLYNGGSGTATIDGTGYDYVVQCVSGEGSDTILDGFTITSASSTSFSCMFNDSSSPTVTNCTFSGNQTAIGGIYSLGGSPIITNCTFSDNQTEVGGMYNMSSSPTVSNCTFSGNVGVSVVNYSSNSIITDCTFSDNLGVLGGGILNMMGSPIITNCTFTNNQALDGGGMCNALSSPIVTNCTFSNNLADYCGGGIYSGQGSPIITNCTFTNNQAYDGGGGIGDFESGSKICNCILWSNSPIEISEGALVSYCDVQGGTGQPWFGTGCIDIDPFFADSDGRLSADSPCIDAGDDTAVTVGTDLDGNPRIVGLAVDMGAFEFQKPLQHAVAETELLAEEILTLNLPEGIENSLDMRLMAVSHTLEDGNENNDVSATNALQAFIKTVEAQRGKKIANEDADKLIAAAQDIINLLLSQ